jgi:hypothetical protein
MRARHSGLLLVLAASALPTTDADARAKASAVGREPAKTILATDGLWRFRTVWETRQIVLPSGAVLHGQVLTRNAYQWFRTHQDQIELPPSHYTIEKADTVRLPPRTSADWMGPDFDDSAWVRLRGPVLDRSIHDEWKLILMRGRFEVTDPARTGDLKLSLAFRGGAVVYLNGEEVARAFMPRGTIDLYATAEPYPEEAFYCPEGFLLFRRDKRKGARPRLAKRIRRLRDWRIPAAKLRKGVNVLAVAIHRAPTPASFFLRRVKGSFAGHRDTWWAKIGLVDVRLTASARAPVVPNVGLLKGRGFKVWNQSIIQTVFLRDHPDPFAPLKPVSLAGVRNGTFAGQIVVGDDRPIVGIDAEVSDLNGPGTIPASAVHVRYGVADGKGQARAFDSLEDTPPAEVPVYAEHGGAVQPVWITVGVPADAAGGDYSGAVTIRADEVKPLTIPLRLRVIDWALPPVRDYVSSFDIIESPDSVAMAYGVPLWSEAHLKLLDKTFSLLAPLGTKSLYITCVRRTHLGNEHAMVRWVRTDDGGLAPDFSIVEKYLDVATRHLGAIPCVILYAWEPPESQGHAGGAGGAGRTYDRPILITLVDPETGRLSARKGPAWGTSEAKAFWKRLTDGIKPILRKRGLGESMLFGLIGDARPTKQAMDDMCTGLADAKWAIHSHYYSDRWQGYRMGMVVALWGIGCQPADPSSGYSFGWSNPLRLIYYPREMSLGSTLVEHRTKLENWMGARRSYTPFIAKRMGPRGLGRIGADFWQVVKDRRGRLRGNLAGRYPEVAWGQLNLNNCIPYLLGKGRKGPLATVRSEAFREGLQEVEARIYVEKALLDDAAATMLGKDLIARCRKALDERIRMCLHAGGEGQPWLISSGWKERTERLFSLAAEIHRELGREPRPNLESEPEKK